MARVSERRVRSEHLHLVRFGVVRRHVARRGEAGRHLLPRRLQRALGIGLQDLARGQGGGAEEGERRPLPFSKSGTGVKLEGKNLVIDVDPRKKELDGAIPGGTHWARAIKQVLRPPARGERARALSPARKIELSSRRNELFIRKSEPPDRKSELLVRKSESRSEERISRQEEQTSRQEELLVRNSEALQRRAARRSRRSRQFGDARRISPIAWCSSCKRCAAARSAGGRAPARTARGTSTAR